MDKIEKEILASQLAWNVLVYELCQKGILETHNINNMLNQLENGDCTEELLLYKQMLHAFKRNCK